MSGDTGGGTTAWTKGHWCVGHFDWTNAPGVRVSSHASPGGGETWWCVDCLAVARRIVGYVERSEALP